MAEPPAATAADTTPAVPSTPSDAPAAAVVASGSHASAGAGAGAGAAADALPVADVTLLHPSLDALRAQWAALPASCPFVRTPATVVTALPDGTPLGEGHRYLAAVVPPEGCMYAGADVLVEVTLPPEYPATPPFLRVFSIVSHCDITQIGDLPAEFYTALSDTSLSAAFTLLQSMWSSRLKMPLPEATVMEMWSRHPPTCRCTNFPVSYDELQTATPGVCAALVADFQQRWSEAMDQRFEQIAKYHHDRVATINNYRPMRAVPALFDTTIGWQQDWFHPEFWAAVQDGTSEALRSILVETAKGVYTLPVFSPKLCGLLMDELRAFEASPLPKRRPNSMNNYGLVLNDIGLEPMMDQLMARFVRQLGAVLFPDVGSTLDHHHTFLVQYMTGKDLSLDMHIDDSEVTLNVCLLDAFKGAGLAFCGRYNTDIHRKHQLTYDHRLGYGVIHVGRQRHGALPLVDGERVNLIMWCRSSTYRRTPAFSDMRRSDSGVAPDAVCLSRTHDPDYAEWHTKLGSAALHAS